MVSRSNARKPGNADPDRVEDEDRFSLRHMIVRIRPVIESGEYELRIVGDADDDDGCGDSGAVCWVEEDDDVNVVVNEG
jgi:hypothetical protein